MTTARISQLRTLLLLTLAGALSVEALIPSPTAPSELAAPNVAPTPPPDVSALGTNDGYPRPGCPVFSCYQCIGSDFYLTLTATGSTDCHFCACAPRTPSAYPAECSVSFCNHCGLSSSVVLTTPTAQTCPACGCAAVPGFPTTTASLASVYGQCGGIGYTGPTKCSPSGTTPVECSTINTYYALCMPAHTPTAVAGL
ncbi:hypothetical protein FA13DRAFT_1816272 [Coprinellus micaceus]|uniref:CBM1 domain-containing protein n=1 Tax=Coprinellus micaceus TaxID=71717 RepID=A0A4Y7T083_COPMI|nr:hypothetical protein FA13DRAFT_1816272 [Coprinellus micaceus]